MDQDKARRDRFGQLDFDLKLQIVAPQYGLRHLQEAQVGDPPVLDQS